MSRLTAAGFVLAVSLGAVFAQNPSLNPPPITTNVAPALPGQDGVSLVFPSSADNVKEVLDLYGKLTKRRLIYDAQVQGPVPLVIPGVIPNEEAIKIIEIALLMNQFSLVPTEDPKIWKVLGIGKNPRSSGVPIFTEPDQLPETEQVVSFLFKLNYADPTELATTLGQAFPPNPVLQGASITALPKAGALLVTENTAIIRQIIRIVARLDVKPATVESKFFSLQRADAKDIQEKLTDILTKKDAPAAGTPPVPGAPPPATTTRVTRMQTTPEGLPLPAGAPVESSATTVEVTVGPNEENIIAGKIKITADVRTNRIHIVTRPENMTFIASLIEEFDENVPFGEPSVYPLRFVNASDVFQVIAKAIADPGAENQQGGTGGPGGTGQRQTGNRTTTTGNNLFGNNRGGGGSSFGESGLGGSGGGSATLSESLNTEERDIVPEAITIGNSRVIADKRNNAIIVVGNKDVKEKLFAVIKQLDVRAPQVMIHTCIGQLTLSDDRQTGVNYILNMGRDRENFASGTATGQNGNTVSGNGVVNPPSAQGLNIVNLLGQEQVRQVALAGAGGLSGFFTAGNAFDVIVTALQTTNKFRVTSRPTIFTSNNKKAVISSGEEIAVPTSIQSGFVGGGNLNNNLTTQSSISFKTVALTLEVLPLINSDKEVYLEIVQKIDEQVGTTQIDNNDIPRIATRVLKTTVSVPNGGTLVLGGLIKERADKVKAGIPLLKDIPYVGGLFGSTRNTKSREELVILLRPIVTVTPAESIAASDAEGEFSGIAPDLEQTLIPKAMRMRTSSPEELLRATNPPRLRDAYSDRSTYVKPEKPAKALPPEKSGANRK